MAKALLEGEAGDFMVIGGRFTFTVAKIERLTEKKAFYIEEWYGRTKERQCFRDAIMFIGLESVARKLFDQLTSSAAQCGEDLRKASLRRIERDTKFIADAEAASVT